MRISNLHVLFVRMLLAVLGISPVQANPSLTLYKTPVSDTISSSVITAIHQDGIGFLWIGTQTGLYRLDGQNVDLFSATREEPYRLPVSDVRAITEDSQGNLFIATHGGGLLKWESLEKRFQRYQDPILEKQQYLTSVWIDSADNLWAFTESNIYVRDKYATKADDRLAKTSLPNAEKTVAIAELEGGSIVLSRGENLYTVDVNSSEIVELNNVPDAGDITALAQASDKTIVVGTDHGLIYAYDIDKKKLMRMHQLMADGGVSITSIAMLGPKIWVGTNKGLFELSGELKHLNVYQSHNSALSNNHITTFSKVEDSIFVGTYHGISLIGPAYFASYNWENSGVYDDVMTFEKDSRDTLWIGTFGGLYSLNESSGKHEKVRGSLPDDRVMSLASADDTLWIGTWNNGVIIYDLDSKDVERPAVQDLQSGPVTKVLKDIDGTMWIATFGSGLWKKTSKELKRYTEIDSVRVTYLSLGRSGTLFAVSEEAIFRYDRDQDAFSNIEITFSDNSIHFTFFSLFESDDGDLLVGTKDHGVILLSKIDGSSRFKASKFGSDQGISTISVYSLIKDKLGYFWTSTSNGIYKLSNLGKVEQRYGKPHGLHSDDFNFGAHYQSEEGDIYFGGAKGYVKFNAENIDSLQAKPRLIIASIEMANSKDISYYEHSEIEVIEVAHSNYSITFNISVLDYADPTENHFKHKLKGFDSDWIDNGTNNKATYTNLPPGDYTFFAKGANAAGIWSDNNVAINIRVLPPWWRTYWAYCFYVLFCLFAVWGGMRIYRTHLLKQEAERRADEMHELADVVRDELQETQEIHDDLAQSAHQHSIATLALIRDIISADQDGAAHTMLKAHLEAMELLERHYCFQDGILAANLHDYIDDLCNLLLPGAAVDPTTITTLNLAGTSLIPASVASPLAIILRELVDNALQHAFASDSAANFIQVTLEIKPSTSSAPDMLECSVQDDGSGMPVGISIETSRTPGLRVVSALCRKLRAQVSLLREPGTQVTIYAPMPQEQL